MKSNAIVLSIKEKKNNYVFNLIYAVLKIQ